MIIVSLAWAALMVVFTFSLSLVVKEPYFCSSYDALGAYR